MLLINKAMAISYSHARMQLAGAALLYCALTLMTLGVADGSVSPYKWKVDYSFWSPDCMEKLIISINQKFPGPTIRARAGDTIVVELENLMPTETVLIHWHGIHQRGTPWYDGAGGVSQCAVNPGETFVYKFVVDKAGTYVYHGHLGMQRSAGFYGWLIVDVGEGMREPFQYDDELNILLDDWWNKSIYEQGLGLVSKSFRWVDEPQSLLMEGRGQYNCSLVAQMANHRPLCNNLNQQCRPLVQRVKPGLTYRIRIASVTSLSSLNIQIQDHKMIVVEADGNYVEKVTLKSLDVYSGETYSILLKAKDEPPNGHRSFWIVSNVIGRENHTPPGLAILIYGNDTIQYPTSSPPPSPAPWNDTNFFLSQSRLFLAQTGLGVPRPPKESDHQVILLNTQICVDGVIKWAINNISLALPATPLLAALRYGLKDAFDSTPPPTTYRNPKNPNATLGTRVYRFPFNSTVDFILQNAKVLKPTKLEKSEVHPWHIHGHEFWVLGYGSGTFDPKNDPKTFNLENPPLRNTVPLYPFGWTAIRFVANNPGVWLFHCHLEPHLYMGMGIVFEEGVDQLRDGPPKTTLGCGLTKKWLRPP